MTDATQDAVCRTLAIVPARGGSKGIPRKNIRRLAGHPLIAYSLASAQAAGLNRVLLSTEDEEIAEVGRALGYDVPFLRPEQLAGDDVPTVPVLVDALARLREAGSLEDIDFICLLQPTSPFRSASSIVTCIEQLAADPTADAAVSVRPVPSEFNPHWVYRKAQDGAISLFAEDREPIARRQDLPPVFHRDGSVYVVRLAVLEEQLSLYGERTLGVEAGSAGVNLDTLADWRTAELLLQEHPELAAGMRRYRL